MDESLENPLRRFKAFWLALAAMLLVALVGFAYRALNTPNAELDDGAAALRIATLTELRTAERKTVADLGLTYHEPEGGHLTRVTLPEAVIEKALVALKARPHGKTELLIPGSKTFLEKQAGTHDPTESAFLSK
jgi:hypothetical protein